MAVVPPVDAVAVAISGRLLRSAALLLRNTALLLRKPALLLRHGCGSSSTALGLLRAALGLQQARPSFRLVNHRLLFIRFCFSKLRAHPKTLQRLLEEVLLPAVGGAEGTTPSGTLAPSWGIARSLRARPSAGVR